MSGRNKIDEVGKAETNRLHGMLVHEVSLVDRPANKRRFLLWKRSDQMAHPHELVPDGKGGFVEKGDKGKGEKQEPGEQMVKCAKCGTENLAAAKVCTKCGAPMGKAAPPPFGKPGEGKPGDEKPGDEKPGDDKKPPFLKKGFALTKAGKASIATALTGSIEQLMAIANAVKDATEDEAATVPEEMANEIAIATKALGAIAPPPASSAAADTTVQDALAAAGADSDSINALSKLLGTSVEKAGARMKKERLERFRKAMDMLGKLLKEFVGDGVLPLGKSEAAPSDGHYERLVANVESLTKVVQEQRKEIEEISKAAPGSNQIPVEPRKRSQPESEVAWPLDLNRPITRDTVQKDVSFFEDKK